MYLLIQAIFERRDKTQIIFWAVLIMAVGGFMLRSPSPLYFIKGNPLRQAMAFMGTVHHSDSAMDMLIALNAALALRAFRKGNGKNLVLMAGVLMASYLWHPREFFQQAMYLAIFGVALLGTPFITGKKLAFAKWSKICAILLSIAASWYLASAATLSKKPYGDDEFIVKKMALKHAFLPKNLLGLRILSNSSLHFFPAQICAPSPSQNGIAISREKPFDNSRDWSIVLFLPPLEL